LVTLQLPIERQWTRISLSYIHYNPKKSNLSLNVMYGSEILSFWSFWHSISNSLFQSFFDAIQSGDPSTVQAYLQRKVDVNLVDEVFFQFNVYFLQNLWFLIATTPFCSQSNFASLSGRQFSPPHRCAKQRYRNCEKVAQPPTSSQIRPPKQGTSQQSLLSKIEIEFQSLKYAFLFCSTSGWLYPHPAGI
jgi:hypothetical protein